MGKMKRRRGIVMASFALAIAASLLTAGAAFAAAQPVLDANCPEPADSFLTMSATDRRAETFTAQHTGSLVRGEVLINKVSGSGDFVMQIAAQDYSGAPTNTVLASTTIPDSSVPATDNTHPVRIAGTFGAPAGVVAGHGYALVVSRPGASANVHERGFFCAGQEFNSSAGAPFESMGSEGYDLVFAVFVTPPAPSATCKGRPATIVGTDGADTLSGTPAADVIAALGGNDKVSGLAGNDTICGGAGRDTLNGGKGNDKLYGEGGKDTLRGGPGKDKLNGGGGKDRQIQ